MDTIAGMRTFAAVVESGSFTAAAGRLGMSTALASKYVGKLEDRLGVRLLNRTTRALTLTELGRVYFDQALQVIEDFDTLEAAIQDKRSSPSGSLIVSGPATFGEMFLTPAASKFLDAFPGISIDLRLTDRFVNLVDEGIDLAIRIGELRDSGLIARRLAPSRIAICAAPEYLDRSGVPLEPAELVNYNCILDTNLRSSDEWPFMIDSQRRTVKVSGRFSVNSARAARDVLIAGNAIGLVPEYVVGEDIRAGRLVEILQPYRLPDDGIHAVYPHKRHIAAKVRAFIDFLASEFASISAE